MAELELLLKQAVTEQASDVFIMAGLPLTYKANGHLRHIDGNRLTPAQSEELVQKIYDVANRSMEGILASGDDDFSLTVPAVIQISGQHLQAAGQSGGGDSGYPVWYPGLSGHADS